MTNTKINDYSPKEEKLNVYSHGSAIILSILSLFFLGNKAYQNSSIIEFIAYAVFSLSMISLYTASTLYHNAKDLQLRKNLKVYDHASIFVFIAGTYTPITLVSLHGTTGWILFGITWFIATIGLILKIKYAGKYKLFSTLMYVAMGWLAVFVMKPLFVSLGTAGAVWLLIGGGFYTVGAIFYSIKRIPYNHFIFHIFVVLGSISHFITIYHYI